MNIRDHIKWVNCQFMSVSEDNTKRLAGSFKFSSSLEKRTAYRHIMNGYSEEGHKT